MDSEILLVLMVFLVLAFFIWLVPAVMYTIKIQSLREIDSSLKKQLLIYLWLIPPIGAIICLIMFSKTGQLRKLSEREHSDIWVAHDDK